MAGNFWQSSHCAQWVLDKVDLARERAADMAVLSEDEYSKIMIFYCSFIQVLGEQLKLRQQVIASATVFFKRFYAMNSLNSVDPLLLAPTCVFLSSKVEEFGVISNTRLINTCSTIIKNKINYAFPSGFDFPYRANSILECEFYLLENMDNNSRTWSAHLSNVAKMYGITPPLELMKQSPPSKTSFKEYILTKITAFHESELRNSAENNSKMKYLNVATTGLRGRHHPDQ